MFLELYEKIEQYLINNNITKNSEIKSYCEQKVKELFKNLLPSYLKEFNDMTILMKSCATTIANAYNIEPHKAYIKLINELDLLLPSWQEYFDLNNLANAISDVFIDKYYQNKYKNQSLGVGVNSFEEVISNTINRNIESGYKIEYKEDLEEFLTNLFKEYFDNKNINVFTTRNNSRLYVAKKGKNGILREMKDTLNIKGSISINALEATIRATYIRMYVETSSLENKNQKSK